MPTGDHVLGVAFDKSGNDEQGSSLGTASLFIDDHNVGASSIKTQPGKFMLGGEGLNVGKDPGGPASTTAYEAPFPFAGGSLREVIVDDSGEPYIDLEMEAQAMMSRD